MQAQTAGRSPALAYTQPYVRRIPRGTTGASDSVSRLYRQAAAHSKRIRAMQRRLTAKEDREALKAARERLLEILQLAPWAIPSGAHAIIEDAMTEARRVYTNAEKASRHPRRCDRPEERDGIRAKNQKGRYDGTEKGDRYRAPILPPISDEKAEAFQRELDKLYAQ